MRRGAVGAAEERRGGSDHRKSTSTAEIRKPGAERKTRGERESLSWYSAPHLSGKTCTRWTQLCRLVGQRSSFLTAMAINWKALWKQCAVDRLESLGSNNPTRQVHASPKMIFLGVSVLHLYHRWRNFTVLPWKIINREESLELIYLWEHESFLLQSRCAHSLWDKENCYIQEINYVLRLHVQCVYFYFCSLSLWFNAWDTSVYYLCWVTLGI